MEINQTNHFKMKSHKVIIINHRFKENQISLFTSRKQKQVLYDFPKFAYEITTM